MTSSAFALTQANCKSGDKGSTSPQASSLPHDLQLAGLFHNSYPLNSGEGVMNMEGGEGVLIGV